MMERLRDMRELGSSDEAEVARLLRTLAPAVPSAAVEQRVYARLGMRRRFAPTALRIATAGAVPVVVTAVLGAALAMYLDRGEQERPAIVPAQANHLVPVAPLETARPAPALGSADLQAAQPPAPEPSRVQASPEPPAPATAGKRVAFRVRHLSRSTPPGERDQGPAASASPPLVVEPAAPAGEVGPSAAAAAASAPPEEAVLVLSSLRALRREHDPSRAGTLIGRYLERFPNGVLRQEALAIAIEAAVVRGDGGAAAGAAAEYLKRFPSGRFAGLARKAAGHP
jgi:hypothetical protein